MLMNSSSRQVHGFTLVELMVSTAIIGLIMLVLVSMTNQMGQTWRGTASKIEKFQEARDGFEAMTRRLSQATLNTNWDYLDKTGAPRDPNVGTTAFNNFVPVAYGRTSALRFVSGPMGSPVNYFALDTSARPGHAVFFQAPFGLVATTDAQTSGYGLMNNLLNTWGFYVEAGYDTTRPSFVDTPSAGVPRRWRSRLWEFMVPAEQMSLYDRNDYVIPYKWILGPWKNAPRPAHVLAENVLTLVLLPKLSKSDEDARALTQGYAAKNLSPKYIYDSFPNPATVTYPILNPGGNGGSNPGEINPKNQLPPIVMTTMIAIDELSAQKLFDKYGESPLCGVDLAAGGAGINYPGLFNDASLLEDDPNTTNTPGDGDLWKYEQILTKAGLTYRVFTSNVTIRGAKWSRVQTK
jgi:uncharacterized protein (TIGR02599 family)